MLFMSIWALNANTFVSGIWALDVFLFFSNFNVSKGLLIGALDWGVVGDAGGTSPCASLDLKNALLHVFVAREIALSLQ